MKTQEFTLQRYDADEGKVFDWANMEEHMELDPETDTMVESHLRAKTLFIGPYDSIDNYIEVEE